MKTPFLLELRARGYGAEGQVPIKVFYKDNVVGEYVADILVEGTVIVELKTVDKLEKFHEAQLLNYLKGTGVRIGLLVNMKNRTADIRRLVLDMPEGHEK